nr:MAG TPA: hypothetical protein [Inoviridae sp.]
MKVGFIMTFSQFLLVTSITQLICVNSEMYSIHNTLSTLDWKTSLIGERLFDKKVVLVSAQDDFLLVEI